MDDQISRGIDRRRFLADSGLIFGSMSGAARDGDEPGGLRAGAARRRVTPPLWVPYLTSSGRASSAPFRGLHDDLYARALVLDDGRRSAAVLAVDSIGYDNAILGPGRDFTGELRHRVAAATGLPADALMLSATHVHSAPETIGLTPCDQDPRVRRWFEEHLQALVDTVVAAWGRRVPVRLRAGSVAVPGIARYRRIVLKGGTLSRSGPLPPAERVREPWALDEDLSVLYLETEAGAPHSLLLNYTAHPVVTMLLPDVSADYPGAAADLVEDALPGAVCLVTQGAAGNINSIHVTTSYEDARAIGHRLGRAALDRVERLKRRDPMRDTAIRVASERVRLATRSPDAAGKTRAPRPVDIQLARKLAEGPIRAEVQAMGVGPVEWVSLPGEPFVETGLALKRAGAAFIVGYANGYVGYLPIRRAYAEGGYEVQLGAWSRVAPGGAEQLEAAGVRLLRQLGSGSHIGN